MSTRREARLYTLRTFCRLLAGVVAHQTEYMFVVKRDGYPTEERFEAEPILMACLLRLEQLEREGH